MLFAAENNLGNEGWRGSVQVLLTLLLTKRLVRQPSRGQRKGMEVRGRSVW